MSIDLSAPMPVTEAADRLERANDAFSIATARQRLWLERLEREPTLWGADLRTLAGDLRATTEAMIEATIAYVELARAVEPRSSEASRG